MANIFGILTAIVLAVSAFVALKNKDAYEQEIANRITEQNSLRVSQERLGTAQATLSDTEAQRAAEEAETAQLQTEETTLAAANKDLEDKIASTRSTVESNKVKLEALRAKIVDVGELPELAAKLRAASAELAELEQLTASANASLANLTSENNRVEQIIAGLRGEAEMVARGESFPTLRTSISAIYPTWGFVTLGAGNNAGVVNNSTLNVVRNGETIARLLVTAVEGSTSSASIIPDSLKDDVTLAVGDQVVAAARANVN